ncbi:hypothetical protein AGDE_08496 [Angomonas deanei]|nr:hypothetical protein AGDE_08496 [Angomonas deanei]|eukprot:EPY32817.1 hypothetical protein AGDE_08496 [Angomonas deanei]
MSNFVEQTSELGQKPVVVNVTNFPKPKAGRPCLLTFRNVVTLFHEFGHGLHGMLSKTRFRSLSGTSVARDFLEFPSQINEHWATFEPVLHNYAIHHETGEVIPDDLVKKMEMAENSSSGFSTLEVVKAAVVDLHWHCAKTPDQLKTPSEMEKEALSVHKFNSPLVPPRYHSSFFAHVFQGAYPSSYYVYQWARVLDCDGFAWIEENGGLSRTNGDHLNARQCCPSEIQSVRLTHTRTSRDAPLLSRPF